MIRPLLVAALILGSTVFGQQPTRGGAGVRTGTASIAGVIMTDDTPSVPLARALVTLSGAGVSPASVAIADASGRFAFSNLVAGAYTVTAAKSPYLKMAYGQSAPGRGSGVPVSLEDGQQITGLTWKLPRGGVISGRILDDSGRPMSGLPVLLTQYRTIDGERTSTNLEFGKTDGAGMYRAYGLLPGEYVVSAVPPGDYVYIPTGPWQARDEARQMTAAELRWAADRVAEAGGPPASASTPAPAPDPGPSLAYGRTYFPGTTDESAARLVTLARGEERAGVDFSMRLQPVARIEGRVVGPDGQPVTTGVSLSYGGATMGGTNGLVSMRNLLPGRWSITVRAAGMVASREIDVNGRDVTDLVFTLAPGATISGRVVFESATGATPPASSATRILPRPVQSNGPALRPTTPVVADGTFSIAGLDPGRYRLSASIAATPGAAPGPVWAAKSAIVNGRDVIDAPFELAVGEHVSDVVVTFTDRVTELSGTLFDALGRPAPGYYVVVFPRDESLWAPGSRRLPPPARAATNGAFKFTGLPPGTYGVAAVTSVDAADLADPALLRQLAPSATTIALAEGEKKQQDLKFAGGR